MRRWLQTITEAVIMAAAMTAIVIAVAVITTPETLYFTEAMQ